MLPAPASVAGNVICNRATYLWTKGGNSMIRSIVVLALLFMLAWISATESAVAQQAFGRNWGRYYSVHDWERYYHYPYVYYPQNFWGNEYYRSRNDLYYRYPQETRIPVYNKKWQNYYPQDRIYHQGTHFCLDVF